MCEVLSKITMRRKRKQLLKVLVDTVYVNIQTEVVKLCSKDAKNLKFETVGRYFFNVSVYFP